MHGADAVAQILKQEGMEYLFSYPNHPLIDAAAKLGIRPIIARGEKTLINIADGYTPRHQRRAADRHRGPGRPGIENAFGGARPGLRRLDPDADHPGRPRPAPHGRAARVRPAAGLPPHHQVGRPHQLHRAHPGAHAARLRAAAQRPRPARSCSSCRATSGAAEIDDAVRATRRRARYRSAGDPADVRRRRASCWSRPQRPRACTSATACSGPRPGTSCASWPSWSRRRS